MLVLKKIDLNNKQQTTNNKQQTTNNKMPSKMKNKTNNIIELNNKFKLLNLDSDTEEDSKVVETDEYSYMRKNNIIWGVGLKDMIGVKWSDVC